MVDQTTARAIQNQRFEKDRISISSNIEVYQSKRIALFFDFLPGPGFAPAVSLVGGRQSMPPNSKLCKETLP